MASVRPSSAAPRNASIRALLLRLVLAAALPLAALVAWDLYGHAQADAQRAREQVLHLAQVTASEATRFLGQARNILNGLAARPAVRALDPTRCDPILKDLLTLAPRFSNVVTAAADGVVVCSAVPIPGGRRITVDPDVRPRLQGIAGLGIGKPFASPITGRWVLPLVVPLRDAQGGFAGGVALGLDLFTFPVLPSIEGLHPETLLGIVSADGVVLALSTNAEKHVGSNARENPGARLVLREKKGTAEEIGIDGVPRILGFTPIAGTDWIAVAGVPASSVYAGVKTRTAASALGGLAVLIGALLLAVRWSRKIHDPIAALAGVARDVAAGNLAARAPVAGTREIADVGAQFNRMLDAIERASAELKESEARFRALTNLSSDWYWEQDEEFRFVSMSFNAEQRSGAPIEQSIGKRRWELPDAVPLSGTWAEHRALVQAHRPYRDFRYRRSDAAGAILYQSVSADPLFDDSGAFRGYRGTALDISERVRLDTALRENAMRLAALTRRLLEVQETERRTLARELHDEVGGVLTAVKLNLQSLRGKRRGDLGEAALADGLALVDGAIQTVRSLSLDLRPAVLDDLGLIPALRWYCERQAQRAGVAIDLSLEAIDLKAASQLESACYRIVQEAVNNALRHAGARRIQVSLRRTASGFELEIADDGAGFDVAAARQRGLAGESSGLAGMEERATLLGGRFEIESAPGAGARVRAVFPVPEGGFG